MFWNRKQLIEEQQKAAIVDRLLSGPVGQKLREEVAEEQRVERQTLIDQIADVHATAERTGVVLAKTLHDAEAELARAEEIVKAARAKRKAASDAVYALQSRTQKAVFKRLRQLRESADLRILELELEIERAMDLARSHFLVERAGSEPIWQATAPDQRTKLISTNVAGIASATEVLTALRNECRDLVTTLAGDPGDRLADIRRRMPVVDDVRAVIQAAGIVTTW